MISDTEKQNYKETQRNREEKDNFISYRVGSESEFLKLRIHNAGFFRF